MREGEKRGSATYPSSAGTGGARDRRMTAARTVLAVLAVGVIAFAIGYLLNYGRAQSAGREVGVLRGELATTRLQAEMGGAVVDANRSNYEAARQRMTNVFQQMQSGVDEADPLLRQRFQEALAERDEIITLLSRASPEATARLVLLYSRTWGEAGG
jgi:hypothetical protein